jgi:Copper type II ascorbate-dependent monooxygenase, C-terminal domain
MRLYFWLMRTLFLLPVICFLLGASEHMPEFYKDVLPILQDHCQSCHRAGEIGPMPLLTYEQARPYAAAIREALQTHKMPPWGATSAAVKFSNDPSLSDHDRQIVLNWAANKAPAGNPADAPAAKVFNEGWNIGKPDMTFEMPQPYQVPAAGTVDYTYIVMPMNFAENKWIQAAEVRPSARAVVHHVIAYIRAPGSPWLAEAKPGIPYTPSEPFDQLKQPKGWGAFLAAYVPGGTPMRLELNQGKQIKAGSDLVFEIHYTPNGKAVKDQTKVGISFAKQRPEEQVLTIAAGNGDFVIPPGNPNYPVTAERPFYGQAKIISFQPHMHVRGKSMRYDLVKADGTHTTLVDVPRYDFHWQQTYSAAQPVNVEAGTKIECYATYDNSPNNPWNPDPSKEVRWGDQSWEEMMLGFMEIAMPVNVKPRDVLAEPEKVAERK